MRREPIGPSNAAHFIVHALLHQHAGKRRDPLQQVAQMRGGADTQWLGIIAQQRHHAMIQPDARDVEATLQ